MVRNYGGDDFEECPVCKERSFKYDSVIDSNLCYNELCRWRDKVLPAIDVPMSFLENCLNKAEPGLKKDKIKEIIELTKEVRANIGESF